MKRICIVCGEDAEAGNFCKKCFLERHKLFSIKDFTITVCRNLDVYYNSGWKEVLDTKDMITEMVRKNIQSYGTIKKISVSFKPFKDGYAVKIKCTGKIDSVSSEDEKDIQISLKKKLCEDCSKLSGRYHEAKIQIRGDNRELILDSLSTAIPKTSMVEYTRHGVDILFINKKEAAQIADYLKKRYKVKKSFKVVGSKKGKMLNRDIYSVK